MGSLQAETKSSGFVAEQRRLCRSEKARSLRVPALIAAVPVDNKAVRECDVEHVGSDVGERCGRA